MKVIILAAGLGKRMNHSTTEEPKCLIKIRENLSILDINLKNILSNNNMLQIIIVTGFENELIDEHVKLNYPNETKINTIFNPHFAESVVFSVKAGFSAVPNGKSILLINGDTVFGQHIFEKATAISKGNRGSITIFGNLTEEFYPDDIKLSIRNNILNNVGKNIDNANAVSSGAILLCHEGLIKYINTVHSALGDHFKTHHAVLKAIKDNGYDVSFYNLGCRKWQEFDTKEDLDCDLSFIGHENA